MEQHGDAATETTLVLLTKHLQTVRCRRRRAVHHCGDQDRSQDNWADVCGFLKRPDSDRYWKVRTDGAFSIPRKSLGLRPTDNAAIMRHGST